MISLVLTNLMYFAVIDFAGTKIFEKNQTIKYRILILATETIIISVFNGYGPNHYGSIVFFLLIFFMVLLCYKASIADSILYSFLQVINVAISEFASMFLLGISGPESSMSIKYCIGLATSLLFSFLITFVIIWIFKVKRKYEESPYLYIIFVLPSVTLTLIISVKDYFVLVNSYPIVLIVIIGLFFSNIITLVLFFRLLDSINLRHQLEAEQIKSQTQKEHIKLLNEQYSNNFDYLHDLLHKINSMNEKIRDIEIKSKLEELSKHIDFHFNSILTNSLSLNAAINKFASELEKNEIVLRTTVYDTISCLEFENQVDLFELMLETGMDSCCKCDIQDRVLIIQILRKKNLEIIKFVMPNAENNLHDNLERFLKTLNKEFDLFEFTDNKTISFVISLDQ